MGEREGGESIRRPCHLVYALVVSEPEFDLPNGVLENDMCSTLLTHQKGNVGDVVVCGGEVLCCVWPPGQERSSYSPVSDPRNRQEIGRGSA